MAKVNGRPTMPSAVLKHHLICTDVENFRQFGAIILGGPAPAKKPDFTGVFVPTTNIYSQ